MGIAIMGRKGKTQKHTAAETNAKHAAAKHAAGGAGGGSGGAKARTEKTRKSLIQCTICKGDQPNLISMEKHYDSKHPKIKWAEAKGAYEAMLAKECMPVGMD